MDDLFFDDGLDSHMPEAFLPESFFSLEQEKNVVVAPTKRSPWLVVLAILVVVVGIGAIVLFIQVQNLAGQIENLSTQMTTDLDNLNGRLDSVSSQLSNLENRVSSLHMEEVGWQINGRIQTLGTGNPYTGGFVIVEAINPDTSDWQDVGVRPGGEFSLSYAYPNEPLQVRVTLTNLPQGWQAQLDASAGSWAATGGNTFEAMFNSPAEAQHPLVVNIGVTRSFSGMVQLGQLAGNLPPETAVTLFEQGAGGNWRQVDSQLLQSDGRFSFTYPSAVEHPAYRLEATFGPAYEVILSANGVAQDGNGVLINQPQPNNEVNLVYELTAVTLTADKWQPIDDNWNVNISPDGYTYYTAIITESLQPLQGAIYLPPGTYQIDVWTPVEDPVDAAVQYIVEIDNGVSEGASNCQSFVSVQSERVQEDQQWWDFTTTTGDSRLLRLQSNGGTVLVRVTPAANAANGTQMGVGPVQFSVIQIEPERPIVPCQ